MKKRIIGAVIATIVMMALTAACAPEVQDVNLVGQDLNAAQVSKVEVSQKGDNYFVIASWDAVKNGTGYHVYAQPDGKKTVIDLGDIWYYGNWAGVWADNDWNWVFKTPEAPDNTWKETYIDWDDKNRNTDVDKWSAFIKIKHTRTKYASDPENKETVTVGQLAPGKYRIGIQTNDINPNNNDSEIKWSAPIDIAAPANKSSDGDPWYPGYDDGGYDFGRW